MRLCILCSDEHVADAREKAKVLGGGETLKIGVSEKGEAPATHWFCFLEVDQVGHKKISELADYGIIEESSPKPFLAKHNLKIIK